MKYTTALGQIIFAIFFSSIPALAVGQNKPTTEARTTKVAAIEGLYWYDGGVRRTVHMHSDRTVRFGVNGSAKISDNTNLQVKSAPSAGEAESPIFTENGKTKGLPGGVIVTVRSTVSVDQVESHLRSAGLSPVRALNFDASGRTWLVTSDAGKASLDMANRLQESGQFLAAIPNWWTQRAKK